MSETLLREIIVRLDRVDSRLDSVDARFDRVDARFDKVDARLDQVDARFDKVDARFNTVDSRFEAVEQRQRDAADEFTGLVDFLGRKFQEVEGAIARNGMAIEELSDGIKGVAEGVSANAERLGRFERETRDRFDRLEHRFDAWRGLTEARLNRLESA